MTEEEKNHLIFGGVDVVELAERYGTPLYVTDENKLRVNLRSYKEAFETANTDTDIYYAVKANGNLALLTILASEGAGADVFSTGELWLTKSAGIPAEKILFNGNSKSDDDLRAAVESGVKISVDSKDELRALSVVADELKKEVEIAIRVNPDVSPEVHPKIATGLKESKFGLPYYEVISACEETNKLPNIALTGLHCHIGSQILDVSVFSEATEKMMDLVEKLYEKGITLEFVDLGGGLGIAYKQEEKEIAPTPKDLAEAMLPVFEKKMDELGINLKLVLEPGRSIVASTTILLSRINAVKRAYKNFVAIDAGFNLLIRPVMYDAYHEVLIANKINERVSELYTVVGPVCEAGDIIAKDRKLPSVERGDLVAILDAGAYGFSMSSQYNGRPRCAEVLVCNGEVDLIRSGESIEDLLRNQKIPARLR
ncbi:MAG: diaminopimelate decarboxylase [Methanophagales archaeon]|nr:diaminopimelate decarboxylase [Methanophagales archaeon]